MEFAGYILWGGICFGVSIGIFALIAAVRFFRWPFYLGYLFIVLLAYTSLSFFDGLSMFWLILTSDEIEYFGHPFMMINVSGALVLLHFGPQRRSVSKPPRL